MSNIFRKFVVSKIIPQKGENYLDSMILFFQRNTTVFAVQTQELSSENIQKLVWLFGNATQIKSPSLDGYFVGPRKEMITPWSTNAVEITQNMSITGIVRIEEFSQVDSKLFIKHIND